MTRNDDPFDLPPPAAARTTQTLPDPAGGGANPLGSTFPFEIQDRIGSGGYGHVYRALDPALDRSVAIKVLRTELLEGDQRDEVRRRFLQEARAAAALGHAGIATVYAVGEVEKKPYIAMEYLEGEDLEVYSARSGPLEAMEVADLGLQLLDALSAAHKAGIVHRDVKPSNVMRLHCGTIKVMDFGIARIAGRELVKTQVGALIATPQFASPEQLGGGEVDLRSDLYSAGVLLYHLLSRAFPHAAETLAELFRKTLQDDPVPLADHGLNESPAWDRFFQRALAKRREDRFQSGAEMARSLSSLLPTSTHHAASLSISPGTSPGQAPDNLASTLAMVTPNETELEPGTVSRVAEAQTLDDLVHGLVAAWPEKDLGVRDPRSVLPRLLEVPLHTEAYRGVLELGSEACLFLGDGQILGSLRQSVDLHELSEAPQLNHILRSPPDEESGWVFALAAFVRAKASGEAPEQADLQTSFVHLPRLLAALLGEDATRLVHIEGDGRVALALIQRRRMHLLVGAGWPPPPTEDGRWSEWFAALDASFSVWRLRSRPEESWYRFAFGSTTVRVDGAKDLLATPTNSEPGLGSRETTAGHSLRLGPESESQASAVNRALASPAALCLDWLLRKLSVELSEGDRRAEWKYLASWLPEVNRAKLYHAPEPGLGTYDVVTYDEAGKILHLVLQLKQLDPELLGSITENIAELKARNSKRGDIGAVVILAEEITREAVAGYRNLLHRGRANTWFGVDHTLGYRGFVRLSARRGYHLLLARAGRSDLDRAEALFEIGGHDTTGTTSLPGAEAT